MLNVTFRLAHIPNSLLHMHMEENENLIINLQRTLQHGIISRLGRCVKAQESALFFKVTKSEDVTGMRRNQDSHAGVLHRLDFTSAPERDCQTSNTGTFCTFFSDARSIQINLM